VVSVADAVEVGEFPDARAFDGWNGRPPSGPRVPDRIEALVLMDTSAGPPPDIDAELVSVGADVARATDDGAARTARCRQSVGSAAHERVIAERPGFREYGDHKWATLSPVMWSELAGEITEQPDQLAELISVTCPTLVLVGEEDRTFIEPSFLMADAIPTPAGRDPRRRPFTAVRESPRLVRRRRRLPR